MQVLKIEHVVDSLAKLRKLNAHRNIIMYLCIKRAAAEQGTTEDIKIDFREFFERFLTVRNAPTDKLHKPYIIPFEESNAKLWLNQNLAGSFSPSSIREGNPVNKVISMNGTGAKVRYSLKLDHAKNTLLYLLKGVKLPAIHLAIFLYRDFGFYNNEISVEILLNIFKAEFGYSEEGKDTEDFNELFECNSEVSSDYIFAPFVQS